MDAKIEMIKRLWQSFHNSIVIALLFSLIGIGIGISVSKDFYGKKMDEVIATGAMLHNKKVYIITPKI